MFDPFSIIMLATAAVTAGASMYTSNQAAQSQRKSAKLARRQQQLAEAREKSQMIRQARISYATAANNAENQGAAGSSASLGGLGSIRSQLAGNISFLDQYGKLSDQIMNQNMSASRYAQSSQMWGQASDLALTAAGSKSASTAFNSIFKRG